MDVGLVVVAALLAQRDLTGAALPLPRDLGVVLLELVEEDLVAGALELPLELVVRIFHVTVEVALDDLGRAVGPLLREHELVRLDLREARRQLRRGAQLRPVARRLNLLAGSTLYVYSTTRALQTINLPGTANDAAFLTTGTFGFVATQTSSVSLFDGCDNAAPQSPNTPTVATAGQPALLAALPDGKTIAAVTSPYLTTIEVTTSAAGCPPPVTATAVSHDLGQGPFTPKQILVSSDGTHVYVISNLNAIMVYDITAQAATAIPLAGNATPLGAALMLPGQKLYVGASDGTVHVLNAVAPYGDVHQIPVTLCKNTTLSCPPDLVSLKP